MTPESCVQAQKQYGSDIIIPLDHLPPYNVSQENLVQSVYLSHRWMARSLREHQKDEHKQAMYGVVHGGSDRALRALSAEYISSLPFDGMAVGGSVGKNKQELSSLLEFLMPKLPYHKPVHLLGIADAESAKRAVVQGVDTFDSCFPTRAGRHGTLLMPDGRGGARNLHVTNAEFAEAFEAPAFLKGLEGGCGGIVGEEGVSAGYLRHLFKQHEPVDSTYATLHNLQFMFNFCREMRESILREEI